MLFIATPIYLDTIHVAYLHGFTQTLNALYKQGISVEYGFQTGTYIAMNRENLVRRFLKTDCQFMLFVDSDMAFTALDVLNLLASNVDVVSGVYRYRVPIPVGHKHRLTCVGKDKQEIDLASDQHMQKCDVIPGGMLLVRRSVFEKLYASGVKYIFDQGYSFRFEQDHTSSEPSSIEDDFVGEDLHFCLIWRKLGGDLWVNTKVQPGHVGTFEYKAGQVTDF